MNVKGLRKLFFLRLILVDTKIILTPLRRIRVEGCLLVECYEKVHCSFVAKCLNYLQLKIEHKRPSDKAKILVLLYGN